MKDLSVLDDKTLNEQLEQHLKTLPENGDISDTRILLNELHIHQIELEMQNRELRQSQQELEQARDKYANLYDFAPIGYASFDQKGCIQEINLTACRMLGMERTNILKKPFSVFLSNDDLSIFFNHIKEVFTSLQKERDELTIKSVKGGRTPVRIESIPYTDHDGLVLCQTAIIDSTELKQEQENILQRLNIISHESRLMMIGQMTSEIAHEINQPLATIGNYSNAGIRMHGTGKLDNETTCDLLRKITKQVERTSQIIVHLRKFSQKREMHFETLELNGLITDLLKLVDAEQHWHGVVLEKHLSDEELYIYGDPILLEQAILNILRNALESSSQGATDKPKTIITTRSEHNSVVIGISDNGPGVKAELVSQIFQPFVTTKETGLGLGLSIAKSILDAHHGNVYVTEVLNKYTTFNIELPVHAK